MKMTLECIKQHFSPYSSKDRAEMKKLSAVGFKFDFWTYDSKCVRTLDNEVEIEVNTIDDLKRLCNNFRCGLVFYPSHIQLYNGYRE